ncbi:MAG: purine-binding chemotaxis protein CheW [Gammaproteobacteria bacterium]|nr:chemotaxis protein CheW [Gammaproteobacteria bacterium]NND53721.1 purine-binding chemotaxis protein CheW [Gammaproteobacteria bacterium]
MSDAHQGSLRELRDQPFELLRELERRSRLALSGASASDADAEEWVGIGCLLGDERFLVARTQVREVMMMPGSVTRVPGTKDWVAGLANLRGQLLPVFDLRGFLGAGSSRSSRTARVLVANHSDGLVGIIVDEVFGFRRFLRSEFSTEMPETELRCEQFLDGACVRGDDTWPVFSIEKLIAASEFQKAAA